MKRTAVFLCFLLFFSMRLFTSDWPVYQGNLYFTGNNDEIRVKNRHLKWIFQAKGLVFYPIVSDGKIYFTDLYKILYCIDEQTGVLEWAINIQEMSSHFTSHARVTGKIKYPVIYKDHLLISDSTAIYNIHKKTGKIQWAKAGYQESSVSRAVIDGIYADPVVADDVVYYGTRKNFLAREIYHGHVLWNNDEVESYGGFPVIYDEYVFTQSRDFKENLFYVFALNRRTGKTVWKTRIPNPVKIFTPVVYQNRVYISSRDTLYCLSVRSGEILWAEKYNGLISSQPVFSDRAILFSLNNSSIIRSNPENGEILSSVSTGEASAPKMVVIRDQLYHASKQQMMINGKNQSRSVLTAGVLSDEGYENLWKFQAPFGGGPSQPVASEGVLFLPAGEFLYAVGRNEKSTRVVFGMNGFGTNQKGNSQNEIDDKLIDPQQGQKVVGGGGLPQQKKDTVPTREVSVVIDTEGGGDVKGEVNVRSRKDGETVYDETERVGSGDNRIDIPMEGDVSMITTVDGYIPEKKKIKPDQDRVDVEVRKIEQGKTFVIDNIYFEVNKAYLKSESLDILDSVVRMMKRKPSMMIRISGHTDSTGEAGYNQQLSERRAESVKDYLTKNGIEQSRLETGGYGESRPVADNGTEEGRRLNRRTEFYIIRQ